MPAVSLHARCFKCLSAGLETVTNRYGNALLAHVLAYCYMLQIVTKHDRSSHSRPFAGEYTYLCRSKHC